MKSPLLALAGFFALGIALAHSERPPVGAVALAYTGACAFLLLGLFALRSGWLRVAFLLLCAGFAAAGAGAAGLFNFRFPRDHISRIKHLGVDISQPVCLQGTIASAPLRTAYGILFDLEVQSVGFRGGVQPATGRVRVRLESFDDADTAAAPDSLRLESGDSIRAWVKLRRPRNYANPGAFDVRRWMESIEDLYYFGVIRSPRDVEKLSSARSGGVGALLERTRRRLLDAIDRLYPPWTSEGRDGAVLKAVLVGDRASLDSKTIENFRKTGLYHLLVISGLHVGLMVLLAEFFLRLLVWSRSARSVAVLVMLWGYAFIVEQRAPTLRATLMISIYLLARLLDREHAALNAIGLAALALLLDRPPWLFEAGFQFSFSAALLIVALIAPLLEQTIGPYRAGLTGLDDVGRDASLAPHIAQFRLDVRGFLRFLKARLPRLDRHPRLAAAIVTGPVRWMIWVLEVVLFTALLQLGLTLPMAAIFHRITLAGIGLNALAIPVMTVLLGIAVPTVVLATVAPGLAMGPARVLALIMKGLFLMTDLPRLPAWLSYRVPNPPLWAAWGFAFSLVVVAWRLARPARLFWAAVGAFGIFALLVSLHPFPPSLPAGEIEVTALDCGNGDALFLVLPDRTTMLVDAGGSRSPSSRPGAYPLRSWDPGEEIVSPYLWSRGIEKIDVVVAMHANPENLQGLATIARNFRVSEFWFGADPATPGFEHLLELVRERGIRVRQVAAGDAFGRDGAFVHVLWPPALRPASTVLLNDNSLVMRITHGSSSILLPGDISSKVEKQLIESAVPVTGQVMQVPHHGSKSSSSAEFLAEVSPQVALISIEGDGARNLPHPETLERLRAVGARVYRTDRDGAIIVELSVGSPQVKTTRKGPSEGN